MLGQNSIYKPLQFPSFPSCSLILSQKRKAVRYQLLTKSSQRKSEFSNVAVGAKKTSALKEKQKLKQSFNAKFQLSSPR